VGEDDGVWNDNDYALFYAQGPNGYNLYDTNNGNGFKRKRPEQMPVIISKIYMKIFLLLYQF
jgi:hypothetical protein